MIRRLRRDEAGYSLVEVVVSILILSIAIIPMVAMFDAGLRAATLGGNYDTARTLANQNLEQVKAMDFGQVEALSSCPTGREGFDCDIDNDTYLDDELNPADSAQPRLQVEVTVEWDGREYSTSGLVVRGSP